MICTPEHCLIAAAWKLGINDPTLIAWIIVAAYLLATWYCWRVARRISKELANTSSRANLCVESTQSKDVHLATAEVVASQDLSKRKTLSSIVNFKSAALWYLLAAIMLVMGANKQLDLHGPIVPRIQKALFWNDYWSFNAILFVVVASLMTIVGLVVGIRWLIRQSHRLQLAYLALASMLVLEVVRFSPNRFSKLLVYHLLNEDESWLHIHTIELLELFVLLVICWLARTTIQQELEKSVDEGQGLQAEAEASVRNDA